MKKGLGGGKRGGGRTGKKAGRAPLLSREDEIAIAKRIKAGGHDGQVARGEMARANLLLVVKIAMKYTKRLTPRSKYDLEFLDLIQQGNIGLMAAIDKFDYQ